MWRIPHHLGFFNANPPVVAACASGNDFFFVNNQHELFRQKADEQTATKIYDFENEELPKEMYANGEDLYYYNANNQLFRLNLGSHYIINQLFKRPQLLAKPTTRITAMALLPHQGKILIGVQDDLLSIDAREGKIDTIKAMNNRHITAFHQVENSEDIYIATLNHGVFVGQGNQVKSVVGTEDKAFIGSLLAYGKRPSRLLMLTNHHLQILGSDSIRAEGCGRMFCINDSIVYTIPETGIHKYIIKGGRLEDCGSFFADIHFNARAGFIRGNTLYIGSNLGVAQITPGKEETAQWITFDNKVPSLQLIAVKNQYENIFTPDGLKLINGYISSRIKQLQQQKGYEMMTKALADELLLIEKDIANRDRIVLLRVLQTIDKRIAQVKHLKTLQQLMQEYAAVHDRVVQENEERRMKKFNAELFADIESATRDITTQIANTSNQFFKSFAYTDKDICKETLHFTTANNQQVRVLILLLAMPRVKRTLLPGMLGIYGNLNPVVSRLYHSKIGNNNAILA